MSQISIILALFNGAKTLSRCLDSLIGQTIQDMEIICINDGSTDNSLKILQEYAQKDNRLQIINQKNKGVEYARSVALQSLKTPYFCFCDADDYYEPDYCEKMLQAIVTNEADMAVCQTILHGDTNSRPWVINYFKPKILGLQNNIPKLLPLTNYVLWNKVYKTELIHQYGLTFPQDEKIKRGYDILFTLQYISLCKKVYYLPNQLYNYFLSDDSLSGTYFKKQTYFLDEIYGWEYASDFILKWHLECPELYQYMNQRWIYLFDHTDDLYKNPTYLIMNSIIKHHKKHISKENLFLYNILHNKKREIFDE